MKLSTRGCTDALRIMLRSADKVEGITLNVETNTVELRDVSSARRLMRLCENGIEVARNVLGSGGLDTGEFTDVWDELDGFERLRTKVRRDALSEAPAPSEGADRSPRELLGEISRQIRDADVRELDYWIDALVCLKEAAQHQRHALKIRDLSSGKRWERRADLREGAARAQLRRAYEVFTKTEK